MSSFTRILLAMAALAALGIWVLLIAVASDFHEATVLLLGIVWFLFALALAWHPQRRRWQGAVLLLLLAVMLIFGAVAKKAGDYRAHVRLVVTNNLLVEVARSLHRWQAAGETLPNCSWTCLSQKLQESKAWNGLSIPYENRTETIRFETIPRADEWGCKYLYQPTADGHFTLTSSGPDRRLGTADDLVISDQTVLPLQSQPIPVYSSTVQPNR